MRRQVVTELIRCLQEKYGDAYSAWGTDSDENEGTGFVIAGLPVFFSAMSFGDIPVDKLDVQIDSNVQVPEDLGYDQYVIHVQYSVQELVALVEEYRKPLDHWPSGN
jgi:hypothetical protein